MINSMIKRNLKQKAVWWQATGRNRHNETTFADAVEIDCRWENKVQLVKDADGKEIISKAQVFHDKNVDERDYLFEGTLSDLDSAAEEDPYQATGAYEVKSKDDMASLGKSTKTLKIAYLG